MFRGLPLSFRVARGDPTARKQDGGAVTPPDPDPAGGFLMIEDGSFLTLESGDRFQLEYA